MDTKLRLQPSPISIPFPDSRSGYGVVELAIIVTILGVLSAAGAFAYSNAISKARVVQAISDLGAISIAIEGHEYRYSDYPTSLAEVGFDGRKDPWGNLYIYVKVDNPTGGPRTDGGGNPINTDFELYSPGEDGATASSLTSATAEDDLVRASNGKFLGLASNYGKDSGNED